MARWRRQPPSPKGLWIIAAALPLAVGVDGGGDQPKLRLSSVGAVTALLPPRAFGATGSGARLLLEAPVLSSGEQQCLHWRSSRPDLVRVADSTEATNCVAERGCLPAAWTDEGARRDGTCSSTAVIESVAIDDEGTALVTATGAGDQLFCEVRIERLARLEAVPRARRVSVGDVTTITVSAYSSQGDLFSSLEGLEFEWRVSNQGLLRGLAVADFASQLSLVRRHLLQQGGQPDIMTLRGLATGHANVSVRLASSHGGKLDLVSQDVEIVVMERLVVLPAEVILPTGGVLQPRLKVLPGASVDTSRLADVPLPSVHFRWRAEIEEAFSERAFHVDSATGTTTALAVGRGSLVVDDLRIEKNWASAKVTVAEPIRLQVVCVELQQSLRGKLELDDLSQEPSVASGAIWQLIRGRSYALRLELFEHSGRQVHVAENFRIKRECHSGAADRPCLLNFVRQTATSSVAIVDAMNIGTGSLEYFDAAMQTTSTLMKLRKLATKQSFEVVDPVEIRLPFGGPLLLPPEHSFKLQASGGSGVFSFILAEVDPPGVLAISSDGVVTSRHSIGKALVQVADVRNSANNVTIPALVRQVGGIELQPARQHLPLLPSEAEEINSDAVHVIPIRAWPLLTSETTGGEDASFGGSLRFWNCSGIGRRPFSTQALVVNSSEPSVAIAVVASSQSMGENDISACAAAEVRPRSPGVFTVSAELMLPEHGGDTSPTDAEVEVRRLHAEAKIQIFSPLRLIFDSGSSDAKKIAVSDSAVLLAICASATLRVLDGPTALGGRGGISINVTMPLLGTHLRLRQLGEGRFQMLCLRATSQPVEFLAEARLLRSGVSNVVVSNVSGKIWCVAPTAAEIVPGQMTSSSPALEMLGSKGQPHPLAVRRGRTHQFSLSLLDSRGRPVRRGNMYHARWSIGEGWGDQQLLSGSTNVDDDATIFVPSDASLSLSRAALLAVEADAPTLAECTQANELDRAEREVVQSSLDNLVSPLRASQRLRAAPDLALRWVGYPSSHFPFSPQWGFEFHITGGSSSAQLRLEDSSVVGVTGLAEVVLESQFCVGGQRVLLDIADHNGCIRAMEIVNDSSARGNVTRKWFVRPVSPGKVRIIVEDFSMMGAMPEIIDITFLPVERVAVSLSRSDSNISNDAFAERSEMSLLQRGRHHDLHIQIWDEANNTLGPESWRPLQLRIDSNDSSLKVLAPSMLEVTQKFSGRPLVVPKLAGSFWLKAVLYSHAGAAIESNTLALHVFDPFMLGPSDVATIPGQTFEYTLIGGPANHSEAGVRARFESSATSVASVERSTGLLVAYRPGETTIVARLVDVGSGQEISRADARVTVVVPVRASIEHASASEGALFCGAAKSVRLVANLFSQTGLRLTQFLLSAPRGQMASATHGCHFRWTSSDSSVAFTRITGDPTDSGTAEYSSLEEGIGMDSVEASVLSQAICSKEKVTVSLEVTCRGASTILAERSWLLRQPLRLLSPNVASQAQRSDAVLSFAVPSNARVPLKFNAPASRLRYKVASSHGSHEAVLELVEVRDESDPIGSFSLELVAQNARAGEVLISVWDDRTGNQPPALSLLVAVRAPSFSRLEPAMSSHRCLPIGSVMERQVLLADAFGTPLILPPTYSVDSVVSHPSVLVPELSRDSGGETHLALRAIGPGCASVGVGVSIRGAALPSASATPLSGSLSAQSTSALVESLQVCVIPSVLEGHDKLYLSPGSRLQLSLDAFAMAGHATQTLSLRLACLPAANLALLAGDVGSRLATEVTTLLDLPHKPRVQSVRWAPHSAPLALGCHVAGVDIDLELLGDILGAAELAETLWRRVDFQLSTGNLTGIGPLLQRLDFWQSAGAAIGGKDLTAGISMDSQIVEVRKREDQRHNEEAFALRPGATIVRLRSPAGVTKDFQIQVSWIENVQVGPIFGGSLLEATCGVGRDAPSTGVVATNLALGEASVPLTIPLHFFTAGEQGHRFRGEPDQHIAVELRSGPFHTQGFSFECAPSDTNMFDFFTFETWSWRNRASSGQVVFGALDSENATNLQPQAACVIRSKPVDIRRWSKKLPPRQMAVEVYVTYDGVKIDHGVSAQPMRRVVASWPFVPQPLVLASSSDGLVALPSGSVCATLTASEPLVTIWVWTGGHPVEASLAGHLRGDPRPNALGLQVRMDGDDGVSMSVTLSWNSPHPWGGEEDVPLRLESRSSCQVVTMRVHVDGSALAGGIQVTQRGSVWKLAIVFVLLAVFALCLGSTRQLVPVSLYPPAKMQPSSPGLGSQARMGQASLQQVLGSTPMQANTGLGSTLSFATAGDANRRSFATSQSPMALGMVGSSAMQASGLYRSSPFQPLGSSIGGVKSVSGGPPGVGSFSGGEKVAARLGGSRSVFH